MNKIFCVFLLVVINEIALLQGENSEENSKNLREKIERFSRYEGYEIAAKLKNQSEWIDLPSVVQGIQDYIAGRVSPSIIEPGHESEYCRMMMQLFDQTSKNNLQKAASFLQALENKAQLHSLEDGKILYEVLADGRSIQCVQKDSIPLLHYSIFLLPNEGVVDTRRGHNPCRVPLSKIITGFAKGVEGMRLGERRKIFIHPDFGYSEVGHVPPNSLLIVDVEVIGL
jgi:FKBP-type peptidyl-prolyl cis-trans isomerase